MKERRMFSRRIVNSAKFLKMGAGAKLLYFYLCMGADDDGVAEAYPIRREVGASDDDLENLVGRGFVRVLDHENEIVFVVDWCEHNRIRNDRIVPSIYRNLIISQVPDYQLPAPRERADRAKKMVDMPKDGVTGIGQAMDSIGTAHGHHVDSVGTAVGQNYDVPGTTMGQQKDGVGTSHGQHWDGLGKDSIGKDSIYNTYIRPDKEPIKEQDKASERVLYQQIVDAYNTICVSLPKVQRLSDKRKRTIEARIKAGYTPDDFEKLFEMAEASGFLKGQGDRGWCANFDWLIEDKNIVKVLEGHYADQHDREEAAQDVQQSENSIRLW